MKLKDMRNVLDELLLSNNFNVNWAIDLRKTKMQLRGLYESEYDDDDKLYHVIRINEKHSKEDECIGTLIHELIHCEQAESGLELDHDEYFNIRAEHLKKLYKYSINGL